MFYRQYVNSKLRPEEEEVTGILVERIILIVIVLLAAMTSARNILNRGAAGATIGLVDTEQMFTSSSGPKSLWC
jgi:hypothetical protein